MNGSAIERVFRAAGGRIIPALAARFRDLSLAEDAFAEGCARAVRAWPDEGVPKDPAAWLYQVAVRVALDQLRAQRTRLRITPDPPPPEPTAEDAMIDDRQIIPDERLRLIFICCHPAVAPDSRAALTLRLVCGLTTTEIARLSDRGDGAGAAAGPGQAQDRRCGRAVRIAGAGTLGRASRGGDVDRRGRLFQSP